ncbi:MAG TPA: hypothetical protein VGS08_04835 [Candidatus Saccharimonadales bacterium]|nr:hypothetical protein [Candidatus Saccharimonadales bacterium]
MDTSPPTELPSPTRKRLFEFRGAKLLGLVSIALITVLAIAAYTVSTPLKNHPQKPSAPVANTTESLAVLITSLRTILQAHFSYLGESGMATQNVPGYSLPGYDFQVIVPSLPNSSMSLHDQRSGSEQATYDELMATLPAISNYLQQHGYQQQTPTTQPGDNLLSVTYFYRSTSNLCQISIYTQLDIACVPISQLASIATQDQTLVHAYAAETPDLGINAINAAIVSTNQTSGFLTAILPIYNNAGETKAYLYKQGASNWQLVNLNWYNDPHENGNIMPNCEDFESLSATRQAFLGVNCYDSARRIESIIH